MVPKTVLFIYNEELESGCKEEEGEWGKCCLARCDVGAGAAMKKDPGAVKEAEDGREA